MTGISTEFRNTCLYGFTLAEVLIALTVLGIIASLTIPTVIQKQREAANRTKIKKAMTVYDRMFSKMIIENNLKSDQAVRAWAEADCSNTSVYFKIAESLSTENSCTFQTSDGVFWDITDIFHPVISLNKDDLDDLTSKNTFRMVTSFDSQLGAFRTNDLQYEIANNGDEEEMEKLFTFVKLKDSDENGDTTTDDLFSGKLEDFIAGTEAKKVFDDFQNINIWEEFNYNNKRCSTVNGKEYCATFDTIRPDGTYSSIQLRKDSYSDYIYIVCSQSYGCSYNFQQDDGISFTVSGCQLESGKMRMDNCRRYSATKKLNENVEIECETDSTGKCKDGANSYSVLSDAYTDANDYKRGENCDSNGKNCESCYSVYTGTIDCSELYATYGN